MELAQLEAGLHYYVYDAEAVHAQAESALAAVARETLEKADVPAGRVALFIAHYVDHRVARRAIAALGVEDGRIVAPAESFGHVSGAGIPIALAEAIADGRVGRGDLVCCVAFGAGMSWGGALLRL
jgi:3-oxoacyl-[acyl-carrier-protein] synthase-3